MIDRLIPRYPTFLILGFLVMVSALFALTPARDAMITIWANKLFNGDTDQTIFKATQITDQVIGNTLTVWLFVGLSFIKLGIGSAIATIVRNLRATARGTQEAYASAGVAEAAELGGDEPWFGRWFTRMLFIGMGIMLFAFALTLWADANIVFLMRAEFAGQTSGFGWESYVYIDKALKPIIFGTKFLGEALLITGIAAGLATIILHLSKQATALPALTRIAMGRGNGDWPREPIRPYIASGFLAFSIAGGILLALSLPAGFVQAGFGVFSEVRAFDGFTSGMAIKTQGVLARSIDPMVNLGLGLLFFGIALLLLTIIHWLREQRRGFGDLVADMTDGAIAKPTIEASLWPTRLVMPLAISGLLIIVFFAFTATGVRALNFVDFTDLRLAGDTASATFQNQFRLDQILGPVIGATRFIGVGLLMLAIGLALVTIVINLRATALILPSGFAMLIPKARGEEFEAEELQLDEPMALAPWELLWPHLAGLAMIITATLPIVILRVISVHRNLEEQFAGHGLAGDVTGLFKSSFLSLQLLGASQAPWMLFGMGLILFAIGRFFSTIVTFVELRRMVINESTEAIADAVK
ncbi:MAG: hypothetical protein IIC82_08710 [Chloroflexi bacterium]|nr:hypothetical protein [Chloroflexota bacterium]